jgi:hypothetical protein
MRERALSGRARAALRRSPTRRIDGACASVRTRAKRRGVEEPGTQTTQAHTHTHTHTHTRGTSGLRCAALRCASVACDRFVKGASSAFKRDCSSQGLVSNQPAGRSAPRGIRAGRPGRYHAARSSSATARPPASLSTRTAGRTARACAVLRGRIRPAETAARTQLQQRNAAAGGRAARRCRGQRAARRASAARPQPQLRRVRADLRAAGTAR